MLLAALVLLWSDLFSFSFRWLTLALHFVADTCIVLTAGSFVLLDFYVVLLNRFRTASIHPEATYVKTVYKYIKYINQQFGLMGGYSTNLPHNMK